ncbi:hypothetical protein TWF569_007519 [Orbilia oligospora]|nr:hypothetical protein TWF569_007519 [Orbilia oligospora]
MALYNPESGEIFYLEQVGSIHRSDENENVTTLEDIDRLGEEGTVWRAKMGIENMPLVLHEDLVEGQYPTTWDAVKAKGGPTP